MWHDLNSWIQIKNCLHFVLRVSRTRLYFLLEFPNLPRGDGAFLFGIPAPSVAVLRIWAHLRIRFYCNQFWLFRRRLWPSAHRCLYLAYAFSLGRILTQICPWNPNTKFGLLPHSRSESRTFLSKNQSLVIEWTSVQTVSTQDVECHAQDPRVGGVA